MTRAGTIPPRLADWRVRLDAYFAMVVGTPFQYGRHDCALFVAGAVEAMTGSDPAAPWRGRYTTLEGGLKALRKAAYLTPLELVGDLFAPVAPALAQVGDIAQLDVEGGLPALGIVAGEVVAVLRPEGLGWVPRMLAVSAWRVS